MAIETLKNSLTNWTDFDIAGFEFARCIGLIRSDVEFGRAKHVFWGANPAGEAIHRILFEELVKVGVLEVNPEDEIQVRWNSDFVGTWER
jgi:hypothetical protein